VRAQRGRAGLRQVEAAVSIQLATKRRVTHPPRLNLPLSGSAHKHGWPSFGSARQPNQISARGNVV